MKSPLFSWCAVFALLRFGCGGSRADDSCATRQTLELAVAATVKCSFPTTYFGVYWFNTQDLTKQPFLYKEEDRKAGSGFDSGEFDVDEDGSLVIKNVTIQHERIFNVIFLQSEESNPLHHNIEVEVYARPSFPFPVIDACNHKRYCYINIAPSDTLQCSVRDAKPTVELSWMLKTVDGDEDQTVRETYSSNGHLNTSLSTMVFKRRPNLNLYLFVCKAEGSHLLLDHEFSFIVAEIYHPIVDATSFNNLEGEDGAKITLQCSGNEVLFFIWKKEFNETHYDVLAHGYVTIGLTEVLQQPYALDQDGSLILPRFSDDQEGVYICISMNGGKELTAGYKVTLMGADDTVNRGESIRENILLVIAIVLSLGCVTIFGIFALLKVVRCRRRRPTDSKHVEGSLPEQEPLNVTENGYDTEQAEQVPLSPTGKKGTTENAQAKQANQELPNATREDNKIDKQTFDEKDNIPTENSFQRLEKSYINVRTYTVGKRTEQREEKVMFLIGEKSIDTMNLELHIVKYFTGTTQRMDLQCKQPKLEKIENGIKYDVCYVKKGRQSLLPFDITFIIIDSEKHNETDHIWFKEITQKLIYLTSYSEAHKLRCIKGIVVVQAITQLESFPPKDILFHPILRIIGNDLLCKVSLIVTIDSEETLPSSIAKDEKRKYPCAVHFSSFRVDPEDGNSVASIHQSDTIDLATGSEINVDMWDCQLCEPSVLCKKSTEVWERRMQLAELVPKLCESMVKYIETVETLEEKVTLREQQRKKLFDKEGIADIVIYLQNGEMAMNCLRCKHTCHYPCNHDGVMPCSIFLWHSLFQQCCECVNNCDQSIHERHNFRYITEKEINEKLEVQSQQIERVKQESTKILDAAKGNAEEIDKCLQELKEMAIQPTHLKFNENSSIIDLREEVYPKIKCEGFMGRFNRL